MLAGSGPADAPERRRPATRPDVRAVKAVLGAAARPVYAAHMADGEILVDARGHRCPVPTLRLRKALEAAAPGARVRLLADDPMARIDVPHFAGQVGAAVLAQDESGGTLSFLLAKA